MQNVKFYSIKDEVRILGIDDASFNPRAKPSELRDQRSRINLYDDKTTMIVGAIFRGGKWLDGILKTDIEIDGTDATEKIAEMVNESRHRDIRVIMLDGLGFGGFNMVDVSELFRKTKLPVIVIVRRMPDFKAIKSALKNLKHKKFYLKCIEKAGKPKRVRIKMGRFIYIQSYGIEFSDAAEIVKLSSTRSLIPEPIRVAHLIASGIALGESRGNA